MLSLKVGHKLSARLAIPGCCTGDPADGEGSSGEKETASKDSPQQANEIGHHRRCRIRRIIRGTGALVLLSHLFLSIWRSSASLRLGNHESAATG